MLSLLNNRVHWGEDVRACACAPASVPLRLFDYSEMEKFHRKFHDVY